MSAGRAMSTRRALIVLLAGVLALAGCTSPGAASHPSATAGTQSPVTPTPTEAPQALDLSNATIDLPKLPRSYAPCEGRVTFHANQAKKDNKSMTPTLTVEKTWAGDVNHDGTPDTLAYVMCHFSELQRWQVVALQAGPDTAIHTIGQVVADDNPAVFFDLTLTSENDIVATVGDHLGLGAAETEKISTHQSRTYRWNGAKFAQVAGARTFPVNPHYYDLTIGSGALSIGPASGGVRQATLAVTVANKGPATAKNVRVNIQYPSFLTVKKSGLWTTCEVDTRVPTRGAGCNVGTLASGQRRTLTFTFSTGTYNDGATIAPILKAFIAGQDALGFEVDLERAADSNATTIVVTRAA
jgi:hypothetical protein